MAVDRLKKKVGIGRHASSIKRARQEERRQQVNRVHLSRMRTAVKGLRAEPTPEELKRVMPIVMKAGRKGAVHRRKASRLVSRMARQVNARKA